MAFNSTAEPGIIGLEQVDCLGVEALCFGLAAGVLGNRAEIAENLSAHPQDRGDLSATNREQLAVGVAQRLPRAVAVAGEAKRGAAQLLRLAIEDRGLFVGQELVGLGRQLLTHARIGVEPLGEAVVDLEVARGGVLDCDHAFGERLVELGQCSSRVALVEQMDGAIVAQAPGDDRVLADDLRRLGEQGVRLGEAAEVRFLQRFVDQGLRSVQRRIGRPAARRGKEFGRLGVAAGVVAAVGFLKGLVRRQRSGLDAGEGGGIAEPRGGDRNLAFHGLIDDQAPQAQHQRAVVAAKPLRSVDQRAALQLIPSIPDFGVLSICNR